MDADPCNKGDSTSVCETYHIREIVSNVINKCGPNNKILHLYDHIADQLSKRRSTNPPTNLSFIDDGHLEVIGSKYGFADKSGDWPLLDQVRGIRFEFIEGARRSVDICIDGALEFDIPAVELVEIEISYHGQVNILAGPDCEAKSIHLSSQSSVSQANAKD
ncbi:PREDICTED: diacylglycerol kinase [Prunus dulcis]|uniref:PREDICTED: diacylglycerol kinase n=1 Tax=Prunus dulcis TaxID=3755 RepID=A0A5E4G184_PRUDU|nr:PREDICTED: diacylglycerol kinase [Prunus dulcis]